MSLLDIFKKKKVKKPSYAEAPEGKKEKKEKPKKSIKKEKEAKAEKKEEIKIEPLKQKKKISGAAYQILYYPRVTEKATDLTKDNKYTFNVWPRANKTEIKNAVAGLYGVDVVNVNIINIKPKKRKRGKQKGWKKGYKKAIVEIKKGQKIEILPR